MITGEELKGIEKCDWDYVWLYIGKEKIRKDEQQDTEVIANNEEETVWLWLEEVNYVNEDSHEHNAEDEEWYFKAPFQ